MFIIRNGALHKHNDVMLKIIMERKVALTRGNLTTSALGWTLTKL